MNRRSLFAIAMMALIVPKRFARAAVGAVSKQTPLEHGDYYIRPDSWTEEAWLEMCKSVAEWYGIPLGCVKGTYLGQPPKTAFEQRKRFDPRVWLAIANKHGIHSPRLIESVEELPRTRALLAAHGLPTSHLAPSLPLRALLGE